MKAGLAREIGISKPTVRYWWWRWEESGNPLNQSKSGGQRKTTPADDQRIVEAETSPLINAATIRERLQLDVYAGTVRSQLHEVGIHHRTLAIKENLEDCHHTARFQFAQQYEGEGIDVWGKVVILDEKTFASATHGPLHCRRPNMRHEHQNINEVARTDM
ncbi:putative Transposable element Tc1 transposase-like 57 [Homarus americanus]|uniref:Putative Transposable element Tc1 transposase-like 57 n=1 Tax=Homarus americanus TaxID=6706 RepID=A0A8J5MYC2_HOMAM|nr:putative Transposable element Tc1 transposase-like 57 [Homarus americanus]